MPYDIQFDTTNGLHIYFETKRLIIRSVTEADAEQCVALFGDSIVMEKYALGVPVNPERTLERLAIWTNRWKTNDPFSAYTVLNKQGEFLGLFILGHGNSPGTSELAGLGFPSFWGKGYASEVSDALLYSLTPRIMLRRYLLDGKPLSEINATARIDNTSDNILRQRFKKVKTEVHYRNKRNVYYVPTFELKRKYDTHYHKVNKKKQKTQYNRDVDDSVDVTVAQMAKSAFGKNFGKKRQQNR